MRSSYSQLPMSKRLISNICIFGLSPPTLRSNTHLEMLLNNQTSSSPEIIIQIHPNSESLQPGHAEMVFTHGQIQLEQSPKPPRFFSTTITNEFKVFTHLHCLITYEKISPLIVQQSQDRLCSLRKFPFIQSCSSEEQEALCYVPVALCIATSSPFIDIFHKILDSLYSFLVEIALSERILKNNLIVSVEFMRSLCMLLNDVIIPPEEVSYKVKIGGKVLGFPLSYSSGLCYSEKSVAILLDLLDIRNILEIWECVLLSKTLFLTSCDEYVIYLVVEALKQIIFPFKWSFYIIPVLGINLKDYLEAPVPVIIGFNSSVISIQEALEKDPKACIIDIDSNILYSSQSSMICRCEKSLISKKIQLIKTYYYVDYKRFRTYRMNSLESDLQDDEFLNTVKKMLLTDCQEKEKIFVSLVRNTFLEFFTTSFANFKQIFKYDSLTQKMEFMSQEFLSAVRTCNECCMEAFWKHFIQSSTFSEFLNDDEKSEKNNLKVFIEIISQISKKQFKIYENKPCVEFEVDKVISPRKFLKVLLQDQVLKEKNFVNDSRKILLIEVKNELKGFKDYYKMSEGIGKFTHRKVSFSNVISFHGKEHNSIYYGKYGILRLTKLLLSQVSPQHFLKLGRLQDYIFPKMDLLISEKESWPVLMLKLNYITSFPPELWQFCEIIEILKKIKVFDRQIFAQNHYFKEILNIVLNFREDLHAEIFKIDGSLGLISKKLKFQNIGINISNEEDEKKLNLMVEKSIMKLNTCRNDGKSRRERIKTTYEINQFF